MNVEVYTFVHYPLRKVRAGVKMGVDFATRGDRAAGDYCGAGPYAEIPFQGLHPRGRAALRGGSISHSPACHAARKSAMR